VYFRADPRTVQENEWCDRFWFSEG